MMTETETAFGPALRLLRTRRHIKQKEVAFRAGLSKAMLSSYETGKVKPTIQSLTAILNALETDFRELQDALNAVNRPGDSDGGERNERDSRRDALRKEAGGDLLPVLTGQLGDMQGVLERIAKAIEGLAAGKAL